MFTSIVSSPITSICSQQILISSCLFPKLNSFERHFTIIATTLPEQVSISTSFTQPSRAPSFRFITSFSHKSITQQFIKTPLIDYMRTVFIYYQNIENGQVEACPFFKQLSIGNFVEYLFTLFDYDFTVLEVRFFNGFKRRCNLDVINGYTALLNKTSALSL